MALTQISTQGIKDGTITGTDLATNVDLVDNQKLRVGTGNDLEIFHSNDISRIRNTNDSGTLKIQATSNGENAINIVPNSTVELFHNGNKKFETTSYGAKWTGNLLGADNQQLQLGSSGDLQIYHDGTNSYIDNANTGILRIRGGAGGSGRDIQIQAKNGEYSINAIPDGAVELYHDNDKRLETTSWGASLTGTLVASSNIKTASDTGKLMAGASDDLQISHDGATNIIDGRFHPIELRHQSEVHIKCVDDGAVELYHNNTKRFETSSSGVTVSGDNSTGSILKGVTRFTPNDSTTVKVMWDETGFSGAGHFQVKDGVAFTAGNSSDLKIFHDGTHSKLVNSTGDLHLASNNAVKILGGSDLAEVQAVFNNDGAVELYYDNVKQMETTSLGATIRNHHKFMTGTVTQRVFQNGNGICIRPNTSGAGGNNTQGTFIRASANCSNIDDDDTVKFVVFGTGDVQNANNSYAGFSDVNLKQDIVDAGSQWNDIKNLRVRKYRFKNNPTGALQIGCIAQEVETISAGLIETDPEEGFKSLKYSVLYMKAIKCLQEAMAKIEVLETEVAALKAA